MIRGSWEDPLLLPGIWAQNQESGPVQTLFQTLFQRRHLYQVRAKKLLSFKVIFYGQD